MTDRIDTAVAPSDPVQHPPAPASQESERVRVWDPFVRVFHWGLAAAVGIAFATEDGLQELHTAAGYAVMGLIGARLLWGLIGPRHALWSDVVRGPRAVAAYLGDIVRGHPARHLGHNPAGGAMAVALICGLLATTLTGLAALSNAGMENVHEALAYGTLFLVSLHLLGVALASFQHRENLVHAMIDGYKRK
jgi:cytochrome b